MVGKPQELVDDGIEGGRLRCGGRKSHSDDLLDDRRSDRAAGSSYLDD